MMAKVTTVIVTINELVAMKVIKLKIKKIKKNIAIRSYRNKHTNISTKIEII